MNKRFKICLAPVLLTVLCPAQEPGVITISVHDYANVSADALAKAEREAQRIFRQAGILTTWVNCSPSVEPKRIESARCTNVDSTHLVLKILQNQINPEFGDGVDVLGAALVSENHTSYYAYAYYGRIQKLSGFSQAEHEPLAAVLVHEVGHLLLQTRSHSLSGIMSARWRGDELRLISQGLLYFTSDESRLMRTRVEQLSLAEAKQIALSSGGQ